MPLLSELGWILEVLKLLSRFAPLADRLIPHPQTKELPAPVTIDALDAELQEQITALRNRFEAPINDLHKRVQEQNLKLQQIQQAVNDLQAEMSSTQKLTREIKQELASLRLWLFVTLGMACVTLLLLLVVLLHH